MTFGARMVKTGLAVTLALYAVSLFGLSSPVLAGVAAIFAMQPSIYRSWRYLIDQLQTNTLGAILAVFGGMVLSNDPIAVGLVCIVVIMICLRLKMGETIGTTLVTVIAVMEASGQWEFALTRFSLSLIGILAAFIINVTIAPPKPKVQFNALIKQTFNRLSLLLRTAISDEIKETVFRHEKRELENAIILLVDKYKLMEEEQKKLKRTVFTHARQLVVYKQMLNTLRKGFDVVDSIEQHYFQAVRTPELDQTFKLHLEKLIKYHEHILWKFDDKLKPNDHEEAWIEQENDVFLRKMLDKYAETRQGILRLSIVSSEIYEYGHQLERLDRLARHSASESQQ